MRLSAVLHRLHLPLPASFFSVLSSISPKLELGTLEAIARPRDSSPPSLFSIAGAWKQSRDRRFPSPASTSAGSNREAGRYVRVCSDFDSSPPSLFSPAPASSKSYFPSMTKIVGTLGPKSRSVEVISRCLMAGMSVTWGDAAFHQETLENLKFAIKQTKKLCAVMLDTTGPELLVVNKSDQPIPLEADSFFVLTPNQETEATSNLLPINFSGLAKAVKSGDTIILGQYLFTGSETTSVWLEVSEVKGEDVVCLIKNSAVLAVLW
ncbi:hypothetical protein LXL04_008369 [Taraxacum kok-saghyz]